MTKQEIKIQIEKLVEKYQRIFEAGVETISSLSVGQTADKIE